MKTATGRAQVTFVNSRQAVKAHDVPRYCEMTGKRIKASDGLICALSTIQCEACMAERGDSISEGGDNNG